MFLNGMTSVGPAGYQRDAKTAVLYRGGCLELISRISITFGTAILVVAFLHHLVTVPPLQMPGMHLTEDRAMAPMTVFGSDAVCCTIMLTLIIFVHEPMRPTIMFPFIVFVLEAVYGTVKITPGRMARTAITDTDPPKLVTYRVIYVPKPVAAVHMAITASFACRP